MISRCRLSKALRCRLQPRQRPGFIPSRKFALPNSLSPPPCPVGPAPICASRSRSGQAHPRFTESLCRRQQGIDSRLRLPHGLLFGLGADAPTELAWRHGRFRLGTSLSVSANMSLTGAINITNSLTPSPRRSSGGRCGSHSTVLHRVYGDLIFTVSAA